MVGVCGNGTACGRLGSAEASGSGGVVSSAMSCVWAGAVHVSAALGCQGRSAWSRVPRKSARSCSWLAAFSPVVVGAAWDVGVAPAG